MTPWGTHSERIRQRDARILSLWNNRCTTSITQAAIAERFGISEALVNRIVRAANGDGHE